MSCALASTAGCGSAGWAICGTCQRKTQYQSTRHSMAMSPGTHCPPGDRATCWVLIRVFKSETAANARRFLRDLERAGPTRIMTALTDQTIGTPLVRETMARGKEFTDSLFDLRKRAATSHQKFDLICADLGIEHRLRTPDKRHPSRPLPAIACRATV